MHCTQKQAKSAILKMPIASNRVVDNTKSVAESSIMLSVVNGMNPTVGQRLSELREAKKISQEQLAKIVGVARTTISAYEIDMRQPSYDVLASLARVFRVSTDYLLGLDGRRAIVVEGLTEPEIEAIDTLVALMAEKNKALNGD